jgi:hypothetical protein
MPADHARASRRFIGSTCRRNHDCRWLPAVQWQQLGNNRWAHTCGKKRNGSSIVAVSRSLRPKRGESSEPASSTTSAASAAGGASEQTPRALDFEPAATAEPPPRYESAVPERQNDAHRVPPAADAEPPRIGDLHCASDPFTLTRIFLHLVD